MLFFFHSKSRYIFLWVRKIIYLILDLKSVLEVEIFLYYHQKQPNNPRNIVGIIKYLFNGFL